jgi:hypothetical protein
VLKVNYRRWKPAISKSCSNYSSDIIQRVFSCELCQKLVIVIFVVIIAVVNKSGLTNCSNSK